MRCDINKLKKFVLKIQLTYFIINEIKMKQNPFISIKIKLQLRFRLRNIIDLINIINNIRKLICLTTRAVDLELKVIIFQQTS